MKSKLLSNTICALLLAVTPHIAMADAYPEQGKTLSIVVPFGPGGAADSIARLLAEKLQKKWKVNTVVENKPGGEFMVGAGAVANAKPDGYTMGLFTMGIIQSLIIRPKQQYDPFKDFAPIGMVGKTPLLLLVKGNSPIKTFKDLQHIATEKPESLQFSSCCTAMLFAVEMLKKDADLAGEHIPYKGSSPSVMAVISGDTSFTVDTPMAARSFLGSDGRLRALAVMWRERVPNLKDIPDLNEVGVPGKWELDTWYAMTFPRNTPTAIVTKANQELNEILAMPDVQKKLEEFYIYADPMSADDLAKRMKSDFERYSILVKENNLQFGQ
ncbi:hypothetical protein W822_12285 [Advenella kashmirensis W13003]|uniref:Uncharacterized protein n=1 Tax=Advenella kashmirensis W13003 TaxID=1424334 RepID=V8QSN6_9BURK|nr:tripartite tricarboxylate transporter substrate binding protein [Advenella kashmirensis]ETF02340.1 hypothetical protein W822_12285 [Advenella kashmirensis W13003]